MTDAPLNQTARPGLPAAPAAPNGSLLTYAFVGASIAAAVLAAVAAFYDLNLLRFPWTSAGALTSAAVIGVAVHLVRTRRHRAGQAD